MQRIIMVLVVAAALATQANAQYNGTRATMGNCLIAIDEAERHGNEWQAPFDMDDCRAIAGKAIDDGMKMIEKSQQEDQDDQPPKRRKR
jgi:hypothetical protein